MFNSKRRWSISLIENPHELAWILMEHIWCPCCGFRVGEYWFLNDATSAAGAQEDAVITRFVLRARKVSPSTTGDLS